MSFSYRLLIAMPLILMSVYSTLFATQAAKVVGSGDKLVGADRLPPVQRSILDNILPIYLIRANISELTRAIRRRLGADFRWAYPASTRIFTEQYVTLDARAEPLSVSSILDLACAEVGLQWRWYQGTVVFIVPLSDEEAALQQSIWSNESAEFEDRVEAARQLAHAGNSEAMVWIFQQLRGKKRDEDLYLSGLRQIGRQGVRLERPDGLLSPYLLVGDHPEVTASVRETLKVDQEFGLCLAIAAGINALENEIVDQTIAQGLKTPIRTKPQRDFHQRKLDRYQPFFSFDRSRNQLQRLQDQYLRVVASDSAIERLIAILPQTEKYFRQRVINTIGWRLSPQVVSILEDLATPLIAEIADGRQFPSLQDPRRNYLVNDLDELQWAVTALVRTEVPGWNTKVYDIIDDPQIVADPVREALIPTLAWDRALQSAEILSRYVLQCYGSDNPQESVVGDRAIQALGRRVDIHAEQVLRQILNGANSAAADTAALYLAARHDEQGARRLAAAIARGDSSNYAGLLDARLPWVPEAMEQIIINGDEKMWAVVLGYGFYLRHRSLAGDSLARRIALGDQAEALRLAAINGIGLGGSRASRDPQNWLALQQLLDDPSSAVRKKTAYELSTGTLGRISENRQFMIRKARTGHEESIRRLSTFARRSGGVDPGDAIDALIELANTGAPESKAIAVKSLKSLWRTNQAELANRIPRDAPYLPEVSGKRDNKNRNNPKNNRQTPEDDEAIRPPPIAF